MTPAAIINEAMVDGVSHSDVAAIHKTATAEVRVSRKRWEGRSVIDLRVWWRPKSGTDFIPSSKGVTIDDSKLPELIAILTRLL